MDIKILINDCECNPTITNANVYSEVQHKKKNMLYSPPQKDKTQHAMQKKKPAPPKAQTKTKEKPQITTEAEKALLKQFQKVNKNQASLGMIHNSNQILQKQNEILQQNQKTLHQIVRKSSQNSNQNKEDDSTRNMLKEATEKVTKEVQQIKKIRDEIVNVGKEVSRAMNEPRPGPQGARIPKEISEMNANLKNLTQTSQNHLEGLQNLEALKSLQNFNVQAYLQSVNTLKKQIIQYQKQSQTIERQLRVRAAKLQKMQISPTFDKELLAPYQKHLKGRVDEINLHAIKDAVYDKIGIFDYGKFECDVCDIMNEVKSSLSDFKIICKEHEIEVPTFKIDQKQLKSLQIKMPSILDEYKASRGISFKEMNAKSQQQQIRGGTKKPTITRTQQLTTGSINRLSPNNKKRKEVKDMITKPLDLAKNVTYTRTDKPKQGTILQTNQQREQKELQNKINKGKYSNNKEQDNFQKYLQNRAREQLQSLYQEKRQRMKKLQHQLKQEYEEPIYINLTLNERDNVEKEAKPRRLQNIQNRKRQIEMERDREQQLKYRSQQQQHQSGEERQNLKGTKDINEYGFKRDSSLEKTGKQALKQKLKQLLGKNDRVIPKQVNEESNNDNNNNNYRQPSGPMQATVPNAGNFAEGIITLLNNALTQVNHNLSKNIERKMENRPQSNQYRQPNRSPPRRSNLPKLEQFRPPPTFNLNIVQTQKQQFPEQKMVPKDYGHLELRNYDDQLNVSDLSKDGYDD